MKNEDADLIQRIVSGDEDAFTALVEKHQKWVHSLAWREIGDFHIAQEITQDTFIIGVKMMPHRWHLSQSIYKALGIPAQFVTYNDTGHEIKDEMTDDITAFFEANAGNEIVEIVPHQYSSED